MTWTCNNLFRSCGVCVGLAVAAQIAVGLGGGRPPWCGTCAAAPQREMPGGIQFWGPAQFDPEKFLEQFLGKETEAQKKKLAAVEISKEEEQRFGSQALEAFLNEMRRKEIRVVSRGPEAAYLQSLMSDLKPLMHNARRYRKITVLVAETMDTDARCFPGGTVVVFRGMLNAAQSEAAVVAVLGHELSHIDHGHQLRHLKSMKLAQQTFSGRGGVVNFEQMMGNTMFIAQSFARPFRPEHESEADADGVAWAYRLGYEPLEFAKLFLRMDRRDKGRNQDVPSFFRTHPYHRDRYEAVVAQREELARTQPQDDLYFGQKNLMELVPRSKRTYDE